VHVDRCCKVFAILFLYSLYPLPTPLSVVPDLSSSSDVLYIYLLRLYPSCPPCIPPHTPPGVLTAFSPLPPRLRSFFTARIALGIPTTIAIIARTTPTITGVSHTEGASVEDKAVKDVLAVEDVVCMGGRVVVVALATLEAAVLMVLKTVGMAGVRAVVLVVTT
jgi:hypothetical protein